MSIIFPSIWPTSSSSFWTKSRCLRFGSGWEIWSYIMPRILNAIHWISLFLSWVFQYSLFRFVSLLHHSIEHEIFCFMTWDLKSLFINIFHILSLLYKFLCSSIHSFYEYKGKVHCDISFFLHNLIQYATFRAKDFDWITTTDLLDEGLIFLRDQFKFNDISYQRKKVSISSLWEQLLFFFFL